MKILLAIFCVLVIASVAWAEKPAQVVNDPIDRIACPFEQLTFEWLFRDSDWGFSTNSCDDDGVPVWEYGVWPIDPQFTIWGTILEGNYPNDAGHSLISPTFMVDGATYLVQVTHGFDIENSYDGGNLSVNGEVVAPVEGYPDDEISDSTNFYAWCVDGEPGFTGDTGGVEITSCFDLTAFMGQEIQLSFDFGSDVSVNSAGWAIFSIRVGGDVVATENLTWPAVKGLYR